MVSQAAYNPPFQVAYHLIFSSKRFWVRIFRQRNVNLEYARHPSISTLQFTFYTSSRRADVWLNFEFIDRYDLLLSVDDIKGP